MKLNEKQKGFWGQFIRFDESGKRSNINREELDLSKPSVFIGLTVAYVVIVVCLILGVPWMGLHPDPIPPEDLPVAIPIFVLIYLVVFGGFYLRDRYRK